MEKKETFRSDATSISQINRSIFLLPSSVYLQSGTPGESNNTNQRIMGTAINNNSPAENPR